MPLNLNLSKVEVPHYGVMTITLHHTLAPHTKPTPKQILKYLS